jgi:hypothetical protein
MGMHADSLFTSLGGARDLDCNECSSGIEARAAVAVQNCRFEKLITQPGSRYIRAYKGGSVRSENNTFAAATKAFEITDTGAELLLALNGTQNSVPKPNQCSAARQQPHAPSFHSPAKAVQRGQDKPGMRCVQGRIKL